MTSYIHGYVPEEQDRLVEQAGVLGSLIYPRIDFKGCKHILEIGSGVGAQTQVLLKLFPNLKITCVDAEPKQLLKAQTNLAQDLDRLNFECQDARNLKLNERFDGAFICWVLEHISEPSLVLDRLKAHLLPGAKIWLTEVYNSSFYFYPELPGLKNYYEKYNQFQKSLGGDPDVGLKLGNLLHEAGYKNINLFPGGFHLSQHDPNTLRQITTYWKGLMKSGSASMLEARLINQEDIQLMEQDLDTISTDQNAVFYYRFVQANATV